MISNNINNYEISQFSSASNKKRSYSNATKEPSTNIQTNNSNKKSSKIFLNNKNNIPKSVASNNKLNSYKKALDDNKNISRTYRTNAKENSNHKNGPALSASSSMEKIERYLMNKFAKT